MSLVREQLHLVAARRRCVDQDSLQDRRGDSLTSISRGDDDRFHEHGRSAVVRDVWHHERGGSTDEYIPDFRHIDHEVARGHHASPRLCLPLGYQDRDTAAGFVFGVDLENSLKVVVERIRTEKADAAVIESAFSGGEVAGGWRVALRPRHQHRHRSPGSSPAGQARLQP
jgi:hypothetical protein